MVNGEGVSFTQFLDGIDEMKYWGSTTAAEGEAVVGIGVGVGVSVAIGVVMRSIRVRLLVVIGSVGKLVESVHTKEVIAKGAVVKVE